jgi:outer membrane protein TolC
MTKSFRLPGATLLGVACLASSLSAQQPDPLDRVDAYEVGEALPPVDEGSTLVDLSLAEAIERALEVNLDLQSTRLDILLQGLGLDQANAAFAPTVSGNLSVNNQTIQTTTQLEGGSTITNERATLNTSVQQPIPWYGGQLNANFNNSRLVTDNVFATRNPAYTSTVNLSYTQPLLAGLSIDNQRASVQRAQIQTEITDLQVEAQELNLTAQVQALYWGLKTTIEQIEIQRRNVAQAEQLVAENRLREEAGRATEFEVIQSEAQLASAQQALLNAEIQWRNQELALKQVLLRGGDDPLLAQTLNPVSAPTLATREVDVAAAVEDALAARTDLRQQREQRRINEINVELAETNRLPTLDLSAGYSLQGVGGDLFERGNLGGEPILVSSGGWGDGLQSIANFETPAWNLGLQASLPVGANPQQAALEQARVQLRQQDLSLRSQELAVVTQVTGAGLAVRNTYLQYEAAQRNAEASELNLEAELARFEVGASTNFQVVTAQNQLTEARLSVLQALIGHLNAITEFERVRRVGN